jgi:hypothetical protein
MGGGGVVQHNLKNFRAEKVGDTTGTWAIAGAVLARGVWGL